MDYAKIEIQPHPVHEELRGIEDRTDAQEIALGLHEVALAIRYAAWSLGTAGASTPMGAIEMLAGEVKEGTERIATALSDVGK
jgi:hypothetical protein